MGYTKHEVVIVSGWQKSAIQKARAEAIKIFGKQLVTFIKTSPVNMVYTFFIAPDGSKEGWETAEWGEESRDKFISYIKNQNNDADIWLEFLEVQWGEGEEPEILRHNPPLCECQHNDMFGKPQRAVVTLKYTDQLKETYRLCLNCLHSLIYRSLSPEQFFGLIKSGHSTNEYDLHDDFYDPKTGIAQQPKICVIDPDSPLGENTMKKLEEKFKNPPDRHLCPNCKNIVLQSVKSNPPGALKCPMCDKGWMPEKNPPEYPDNRVFCEECGEFIGTTDDIPYHYQEKHPDIWAKKKPRKNWQRRPFDHTDPHDEEAAEWWDSKTIEQRREIASHNSRITQTDDWDALTPDNQMWVEEEFVVDYISGEADYLEMIYGNPPRKLKWREVVTPEEDRQIVAGDLRLLLTDEGTELIGKGDPRWEQGQGWSGHWKLWNPKSRSWLMERRKKFRHQTGADTTTKPSGRKKFWVRGHTRSGRMYPGGFTEPIKVGGHYRATPKKNYEEYVEMENEVDVTCPNCGHKFTETVECAGDVEIDPPERDWYD